MKVKGGSQQGEKLQRKSEKEINRKGGEISKQEKQKLIKNNCILLPKLFDLLWEKIVQVIEKNVWKIEAED